MWDNADPSYILIQTTLGHVGDIVRFDSWHTKNPFQAFLVIAFLRFGFRKLPGLTFHKILGTGRGETFTLNDANPRHWALLTVWKAEVATTLEHHSLLKAMNRLSYKHRTMILSPISARGTWAGVSPFSTQSLQNESSRIVVITRARVKPRWWRYFYSQVPPVILELDEAEGLLERFGIGEAPIGLQGTLSIWSNNQSITKFAYQSASHQDVIKKTASLDWYAEELFARFEVRSDEVAS